MDVCGALVYLTSTAVGTGQDLGSDGTSIAVGAGA
jgi:hypothetical protein